MMSNWHRGSTLVHRAFRISLIAKGVDGIAELVGGTLLLLVHTSTLNATVRFLTQHELAEDPKDMVANFLRQTAQHLSITAKLIASIYLLAHGVIKIAIVAGLLTHHRAVFPYAFIFLGLFILLEVLRLFQSFSFGILALMVFDVFVITMVALEYREME